MTTAPKVAPDQCLICRRRSLRGLEPRLVDSEGREASVHLYHRMSTVFAAGFSIDILPLSAPPAPDAWTLK